MSTDIQGCHSAAPQISLSDHHTLTPQQESPWAWGMPDPWAALREGSDSPNRGLLSGAPLITYPVSPPKKGTTGRVPAFALNNLGEIQTFDLYQEVNQDNQNKAQGFIL